jgi:two-component system sensor histidine kinase ChiS
VHKKTKSSLRTVLIIAFVIQIITVVTLTGLLSFYNGRKAVDDLASQLRTEITARISQHLSTYIAMPHLANQMLSENIQLGFFKSNRYFQS